MLTRIAWAVGAVSVTTMAAAAQLDLTTWTLDNPYDRWLVSFPTTGRDETSWIARQTRSGVNGMSRWRTPSGESASMTAFAIAGAAPIVPASPTPFTPIGFEGDGVTVIPITYAGMSDARGSA